jgi:flap endonuclease-1
MGIQNFNKLLREKCPQVFVIRPAAQFRGQRIAVDANNWMFAHFSISHLKVVNATDVATQEPNRTEVVRTWLAAGLDFVCTWLSYGVTPIFVFDGEHPAEKMATKNKRREERENSIQKLEEMRNQVKSMDLLSRDGRVVEELRKLYSAIGYPNKEEVGLFQQILVGIGIPCLQARGDAEQLCSILCIEGKVAAIFSRDTDPFVYGCPVVISEFAPARYDSTTGERQHQVMTVAIRDILLGLEMNYSSLVDLCIMAGCDYNDSIPQVGITRAYELIKKFGSIDQIPRLPNAPQIIDHKKCGCRLIQTYKGQPISYDTTVLNVDRCRQIFAYQPSATLILPYLLALGSECDLESSRPQPSPSTLTIPILFPSTAEPTSPMNPSLQIPRLGTLPQTPQTPQTPPTSSPSTLVPREASANASPQFNVRNVLSSTARDILTQVDLARYLSRLVELYRELPPPQNDQVMRPLKLTKLVVL